MHKIAIEFIAPFRVYLPDCFFVVNLDGQSVEIKSIPVPPRKLQSGVQVHGSNIEIQHDIFGFAGRTKFCLILDETVEVSSSDWKRSVADRDKEILSKGIKFVNRLLEVYRNCDKNSLGQASFHIVPLVRADLSSIRIVVVDSELNEYPSFVVTWPTFHSVGMGKATQRDANIEGEIRRVLESGEPIPIERELISSARNHLWRGIYRLVPVEANTSFESFVPMAIMLIDPSVNISELPNLYSKILKLQEVLNARLNGSSKKGVSWFSSPANGWKTLIESNISRWYNDCYILRNRVIHEGYNAVTEQEATDSLGSMITAKHYIQTEINRI